MGETTETKKDTVGREGWGLGVEGGKMERGVAGGGEASTSSLVEFERMDECCSRNFYPSISVLFALYVNIVISDYHYIIYYFMDKYFSL